MPLLKERPTVLVTLPSYAHPGDELEAEVQLESAQELDVRRMTCRLRGEEKAAAHSVNPLDRRTLCLQEAVFLKGGTVPRGASSYRVAFLVPEGVPPSHDLGRSGSRVSYHLQVSIDVPWWPDVDSRFALKVEHPPLTVEDDEPLLHASHVDGPTGTDPYVEFTLSAYRVVPSGVLEGALALGNTTYNDVVAARVALVATETRRGSFDGDEERAKVYSMTIDVASLLDGEAMPFALSLPEDIAPTFDSELWAISWKLEIRLEDAHGRHLRVSAPITVLPRGSTVRRPEGATAPKLGGGRTDKIWGDVARELDLSFDADQTAMRASRGDIAIHIFRKHRGTEGLCVMAELRYPWLGIGIVGGPTREGTRDHPARVRLGDPDWDEAHAIRSRERKQLGAFLIKRLSRALRPMRLGRIDDESLVLYHRDPGQNHEPLHHFVRRTLAVADAIAVARPRIPAPTLMVSMVPTWERLADRLAGRLNLGDMSVRGRWEGVATRVETVWGEDGDVVGTRLVRKEAGVISEERALRWREGRFERGDAAGLSKPARAALDAVLAHARTLTVEPDRLILLDERGPIDDEAPLLELLSRLAKLAAALRGRTGPYR